MMASLPENEANRISTLLDGLFGLDRYPVAVDEVIPAYTQEQYPLEPVTLIQGAELEKFEGMLIQHPNENQWMIVYNHDLEPEGRRRFTIAHEFGHFILHRHLQSEFSCSTQSPWQEDKALAMEREADQFASSLLMPTNDIQQQMQKFDDTFTLLEHCAERYEVSPTAAAVRWSGFTSDRVVLIASCEGNILWSSANEAAFQSGAYYATRKVRGQYLPELALANSYARCEPGATREWEANEWFGLESPDMPLTETIIEADSADYALTLLQMPAIVSKPFDDSIVPF